MIKFNKHHVTNGEVKARCFYSLDNRVDGRKCVTIYAKDYDRNLGRVLGEAYVNDTDSASDYFDQGRAVLFEGHELYAAARARAEAEQVIKDQRQAAYDTKLAARRSSWAMQDVNSTCHPCHY